MKPQTAGKFYKSGKTTVRDEQYYLQQEHTLLNTTVLDFNEIIQKRFLNKHPKLSQRIRLPAKGTLQKPI